MKFFWFKKMNNYGDIMTPYICNKLGIDCEFSNLVDAEALMIGSIAALAKRGQKILGSGFIRKNDPICYGAKYLWVRGPRSGKRIREVGLNVPEVYGDAALLLPEFVPALPKKHDIGIIPHHVDFKDCRTLPKIDLTSGGITYITKKITECRAVISSSLHGIIVAHAYGIPAAWVKMSNKLTGDDFKFYDHYESVGLEAKLSTIENPIFQVPTNINIEPIKAILCSL